MYKFSYADKNNCLMLKDESGNLVDHKFYNNMQVATMTINDFLIMVNTDIISIGNKHNLENYIINLLD